MSDTVSIFVPGIPTSYARADGGKTKGRFTPNKQRAAGETIKLYAFKARNPDYPRPPCHLFELWTGPVHLDLVLVYPWPKSWSEKKRKENRWKVSRPDADNCVKLVMDSLNLVIWEDDAQVCSWSGKKGYGDMPGLHIKVSQL